MIYHDSPSFLIVTPIASIFLTYIRDRRLVADIIVKV